jgi:hypothetical protein
MLILNVIVFNSSLSHTFFFPLKRSHSCIKGSDLYLVDAVYNQIKEGSTVNSENGEKVGGLHQ